MAESRIAYATSPERNFQYSSSGDAIFAGTNRNSAAVRRTGSAEARPDHSQHPDRLRPRLARIPEILYGHRARALPGNFGDHVLVDLGSAAEPKEADDRAPVCGRRRPLSRGAWCGYAVDRRGAHYSGRRSANSVRAAEPGSTA